MPIIQTSDCQRLSPSGVQSIKARTALTVTVMGLILANASSHEGMVSMGTKIELAKTSGNTQINPATCAVSTFLTERPIAAETQEKAKPNEAMRKTAATIAPMLPLGD